MAPRKGSERTEFGNEQFNLFGTDEFFLLPAVLVADRHKLDKADLKGLLKRQPGKILKLIVVYPFHGDHIQFDSEAQPFGCHQAIPDLGEIVPAGNARELFPDQGIQRDIDVSYPFGIELFGIIGQQYPVGGEPYFREPFKLAQLMDEPENFFPDQRLTAGQSQLVHALGDGKTDHPYQFLVAEELGVLQKLSCFDLAVRILVFFGHAVYAAEIAAIGERQPEIGNCSGKLVDERRNRGYFFSHGAGLDAGLSKK